MGDEILKPQPQTPAQDWTQDAEKVAAAKLDETLHDHAYVDDNGLIHDDPLIEEATERPGQEPEQAAEPEEDEAEEEATEEAEEEQPEFELSDELRAAAAQLGLDEAALQNPALREMLQRQLEAQQVQNAPPVSEQQRQQYREGLRQIAQQVNDPEEVNYFVQRLGTAFGANSPESWQHVSNVANAAIEGTVGLVSTITPQIMAAQLPALLEQIMPGITEMYSSAMLANSWDAAKASDERFAQLPDYGSKEWKDAAKAAVSKSPGFDSLEFRDPQGRLMPIREALVAKSRLLATLMTGGKPTVEESAKLIEAGKKQATNATKRVVAAKTLGAGRTRGEIGAREEDNPIRAGYEEHLRRSGAFGKR